MSFEAFDKLEQLSEELGISRSQLIEKCILAVYNATRKEKPAKDQITPNEVIAKAR